MSKKWKIAVLGSGKVGKLVSHLLGNSGDYEVTAVDLSEEQAQKAILTADGKPLPSAKTLKADLGKKEDVSRALKGADYVLSAAPYHCNTLIATVAKEQKVHYFDLTEDVATTKSVMALAKGAPNAFMPQCGLAPGFISIAAHDLGQRFESLESVKMRVGALPMYPHNRLKYNLTWSTDGLINEYGNPCEAIMDGEAVLVPPLEGLEGFSLDGMEYEAFNTSGGLGTLADTWSGKITNLDYKSVRYPGHREIIALLMNDLKLNSDRATLRRVLENALPHTAQDVVIIFVTACGTLNGRYTQRSYAKKIYSKIIGGEEWGAIQITTAAGACAVLDMHAHGKLPQSGFVRQEEVDLQEFLGNRFGQYYS